jgi:hypothetical protein
MREEALAGKQGDKWNVTDVLLTVASRMYVPTSLAHFQTLLAAAHDIGHVETEDSAPSRSQLLHLGRADGDAQVRVGLHRLSMEQDGASSPGYAAAAVGAAIDELGGCGDGFCRGTTAGQRQIGDPHRHGPI